MPSDPAPRPRLRRRRGRRACSRRWSTSRRAIPVTIAGVGASRSHRRCRTAARCARRGAARRHPHRLPRAARRSARRPGGPVRAHARPVQGGCRSRSGSGWASRWLGTRCSASSRRDASRAASSSRRSTQTRTTRARRGRGRVVRRRGAAPPADALARGDPRQRRARLARGVRAVPAGLAARHPPARGHRRRGRGRSSSSRACPIPASAWESLVLPARVADYTPGDARRAHRDRRGRLVRARQPPRTRRVDRPASRRRRAADPRSRPRTRSRPDSLEAAAARGARRRAARTSPRSCGRSPAPRTSSRSSRRCGTSRGQAGSPTTRSRRCARSLGGGSQAHRVARKTPRARLYRGATLRARPRRSPPRPPAIGGRWSLLPEPEAGRRRCARPPPRACSSTATAS